MYDGNGELTIAFWIYPTKNWEEGDYLWKYTDTDDSAPEMFIRYDSDTGSLFAIGYISNFQFKFFTGCVPPLNRWTMVTYQFTSKGVGQARFYCNDTKFVENKDVDMIISDSRANVHLLGTTYVGLIDEIGWWDRYLTEEEIFQLYNSGNGITYFEDSNSNKFISSEDIIILKERITVLEGRISELENRVGILELLVDQAKGYITFLAESIKKDIVCQSLRNSGKTELQVLGLNCRIEENTLDCVCREV